MIMPRRGIAWRGVTEPASQAGQTGGLGRAPKRCKSCAPLSNTYLGKLDRSWSFLPVFCHWRAPGGGFCDLKFAESDIGLLRLAAVAPSLVCPKLSCYLVTGNTVEIAGRRALSVDGDQARLVAQVLWPIKIFGGS